MNAPEVLETGKTVISLTLLLASPQSTQSSSNKISQSRFFLQFKESFKLRILDVFIKGLIYPEQKVKCFQNLYRIGNYNPAHNILELLNNLVQVRIATIKSIFNI